MSPFGEIPVAGSPYAGACLVATPNISSGVFYRSVILMLEHDELGENGSTGVILNLLSQLPRRTVLAEASAIAAQVGVGGPVSTDAGIVVVDGDMAAAPRGIRRVTKNWGLLEVDSPYAQQFPAAITDGQLFLGYAGWDIGQLETEIAQGSWWVVESQSGDLARARSNPGVSFWRMVLARQPSALRLVQWLPEQPEIN